MKKYINQSIEIQICKYVPKTKRKGQLVSFLINIEANVLYKWTNTNQQMTRCISSSNIFSQRLSSWIIIQVCASMASSSNSRTFDPTALPPRWLDCPRKSTIIAGKYQQNIFSIMFYFVQTNLLHSKHHQMIDIKIKLVLINDGLVQC